MSGGVSIDIGCGSAKHPAARFGVDRLKLRGVDCVCDFDGGGLPFAANSIDAVFTRHTLEHVRDLEGLLREVVRVAKPGASVHVVVPHFSNTLGYSDPTHVRFFGYFTFDYYSREKHPHWWVPTYTSDIWFSVVRREFVFRNLSVFGGILGWLFNREGFLPYLYESKLAWALPCLELRFELRVEK